MRHGIWKCLVVTIVAVAALSRTAAAQTSEEPSVGSRVRIGIPDSMRFSPFVRPGFWVTGTVARATQDSLELRLGGASQLLVARRNISGLEVSEGISRVRSAGSHGVFGAALFAAATYLVDNSERDLRGRSVAIAAGSGFACGAVLGALRPFEHWKRLGHW
jgi:hypothetical protein